MFSFIYNEFFFKPILNFVVVLYNMMPSSLRNMGVIIILVIIFIRLLLLPLTRAETRNRKLLKKIQESGELEEINKYKKEDPMLYMQKMKDLYAKYELHPMRGTLISLFIQFPLFIALYRVFRMIMLKQDFSPYLYKGIQLKETIDSSFFSLIDLTTPNLVLALVLGFSQYLFLEYGPMALAKKKAKENSSNDKENRELSVSKAEGNTDENNEIVENSKDDIKQIQKDVSKRLSKTMKYFFPVLMFFIGLSLPSGITLYIIFSLFVNWIILIFMEKHIDKTVMSKYKD